MGKIKSLLSQMTIRKSMVWTFLITICCICILSGITIFSANKAQQEILNNRHFTIETSNIQKDEDTNSFYLKLDNNSVHWQPLSGKQNAVYYGCYVAMIGLPILYIIIGISTSSKLYYRLKLREPIMELQKGIVSIQSSDLDFSIAYNSDDELGELCASMEKMRLELRKNNKKLWELLEQRKLLNASVAHDLRTPITVLKGYLEYLKKNIRRGKLTEENITETVRAMQGATGRLERYVNCVRDVENLESIETQCTVENAASLVGEIEENVRQLAADKEIRFSCRLLQSEVNTDKQLLLRIIENLMQNAARYAIHRIDVDIYEDGDFLIICIKDDGKGFSATNFEQATTLFYSEEKGNEHFGIGLSICKLLCEKLGGALSIGNNVGGGAYVLARVKK